MSYWLAPYYTLLALLDVVAACIACYVVLRVGRLYTRLRALWLSLLVAGYALLAIALIASAVSYGVAMTGELWHVPGGMHAQHGPAWHRGVSEWQHNIPPHWGYGVGGRGVSPFWVGVNALLLTSYTLILASIITGRVETRNPDDIDIAGAALGVFGFGIMLGVGLNVACAVVLVVATFIILAEGHVPSASIGYMLLTASHILEALAVHYVSADLMLIAEGLRPAALLVIGIGVGVRGRHG